jgi:hypothetical protein
VIIRVMYGRRDVVACELESGYAFRCDYHNVQIGDVVLVPGFSGPEEATVCRLDRGTWGGEVKDVIAMLEQRAFVNVPPSKWWALRR